MIADKRFEVKGGFAPDSIIVSGNLMEWAQKEAEKNMRETNPTVRAFNMINLGINTKLIPSTPLSEKDMQELESFPFSQINNLAAPSAQQTKVFEIQQRLPEEFLKGSGQSLDTAGISKAFGLQANSANEFLRYVKGEIKNI